MLALPASETIEVVRINDIAPLETCAYLFKYDSVFGPWPGEVNADDGSLTIDGKQITFSAEADLSCLDLSDVDVVLECTGKAGTRDVAERGLRAGAAMC